MIRRDVVCVVDYAICVIAMAVSLALLAHGRLTLGSALFVISLGTLAVAAWLYALDDSDPRET